MMTLALLLTAATGAWAEEVTVTWKSGDTYENQNSKDGVTLVGEIINWDGFEWRLAGTQKKGSFKVARGVITKIAITGGYTQNFTGEGWSGGRTWTGNAAEVPFNGYLTSDIDRNPWTVTFTIEVPDVEVEWDAATNTGTFYMIGSDVVLTPIYARAAAFATEGEEPAVTTLEPAPAEGVIAGTDAPLIKEGTGVVAFAGTSENLQGTLWYAIGTSATTAPAFDADAWSTDVPTAVNVGDDGGDVYVWYYIVGADAPDGEDATLDNTFDNTDPVCLTVKVRSNKFDLTLNPANANTIDATQASKGTVTVNGTDKTTDITEGKLQGVKMGSEVKLNTKPGYKFRKVEVKKAASTPTLKDALKEGAVTRIKFNFDGSLYADFTYSNGSFTRTGGSSGFGFSGNWTMKEENGVLTMTADYNEMNTQWIYFVCTFYVDTNEYTAKSTGSWDISFSGIEVNGKDITDQLTKVK